MHVYVSSIYICNAISSIFICNRNLYTSYLSHIDKHASDIYKCLTSRGISNSNITLMNIAVNKEFKLNFN